MTFGRALRAAAGRDPNKVAIIFGDATLTFAELVHRAEAVRNAAMTELGVRKGDNVALVAHNCLEFMELVAGIPDIGAALATINPRLTAREIAATIADCSAKVVFADSQSVDAVRTVEGIRVIEIGAEYEALLANAKSPHSVPQIDETDAWTIPYTSGTTGKPKGVVLSHRSRMLVGLICASEFGCFGPDDRFLAISPMSLGGGLGFPVAALSLGGSIEILGKFEPEVVLERLTNGGITGLFMVPTHFQMIFELPPETLAKYKHPPITSILANAAPLPQAMKEKIIPYFGETVLHELYGATETGLVCNLRPKDQLRKASCVGTPFAHVEAEIRREDGTVCDADEVGELWSRAPIMFNGYWNRPEETAKAVRDGWVSVGDMARRDDEGFIYIVDRLKDMVISGGVNIYPREIEEILFTHPAIADVAVVGMPDERWGERLKTFAVLRSPLSADDIAAFCAGKLAAYKIPKELSVVDELPRNANGKVLKRELRTYE